MDPGRAIEVGRTEATGVRGWVRDLALGARFAVTGGRRGWTRTALTAIGVGLGVSLLLVAASLPHALQSRDAREDDRRVSALDGKPPSDRSFLFAETETRYRGDVITGTVFRPDGRGPTAAPPGLTRLPGPGEMAVSPALAELLASPDGALLKDRLPYRTTVTIGDAGLIGPGELRYYAGVASLDDDRADGRGDAFGGVKQQGEPLGAVLLLVILMACVALLMPVAVFIATAVRFGGEQRDRRLAALRLVGADRATTRRIAAGESLGGALLGLAAGAVLFALARLSASEVTIWDVNAFSVDIVPNPLLAVLISAAVPIASVAVTLFALRDVAIEPLGVVRNAAASSSRRVWWRLLAPAVGLALLLLQAGEVTTGSADIATYQIAAGAILVLIGVTVLVPWLVEAVVSRLDGGPVPWQLAIRRLQLSSGTAARAVSGIVVAAAGAIALQMLFTSVESRFTLSTGADSGRAQLVSRADVRDGSVAPRVFEAYAGTKGVDAVFGTVEATISRPGPRRADEDFIPFTRLTVGDCPSLRELASLPSCEDGDVFTVREKGELNSYPYLPRAGERVDLAEERMGPDGEPLKTEAVLWRVPASSEQVSMRTGPMGEQTGGVLATPSAVDLAKLSRPTVSALLRLDAEVPEAEEYVRNTAARLDPLAQVEALHDTKYTSQFASVRTGLFVGATLTMLLIGASLLVSTLEQLRDRRRLLSVLVAFGTRRATLSWSVLWQTAVPVLLGLTLAVLGGLVLGVVLLTMVGEPVADWWVFLPVTGVGVALILLVTLLSLPPLWRMMRPEGLRTE
ncbi:ABC transporter permease [Streptomyces jumonjinensis]|uniref:ABC transporter permease n=1 Tax=Streptomyces jumonjinensis TaxID=1945 RepID=UPI00379A389C